MNYDNRQNPSPLSIPGSPRSTTPSPKIPIATSFGTSSISGSPKIAFSFNRERAPSLLAERLEEDNRLEQERYNRAFAEELERENRSSLASEDHDSNQSERDEIFQDYSSEEDDELPFQFEAEDEEIPAQRSPNLFYIALSLLHSNHPAITDLNYYEYLFTHEQIKQSIREEICSHFGSAGPGR